MTEYGYAAMNRTLRADDVRTNRGMQQKTFEERGLEYASELAVKNCRDLKGILEWNIEHGISFYRITSDLLPWYSQYDLRELPAADTLRSIFDAIGSLVKRHDLRLTFHPDYFVKLASPDRSVVSRAITDLENHGSLLDAMGMERSPYNSINVHIGAHYGDKEATGERFCDHYGELSPSVQSRLTVENDDKESLWSVPELVSSVHDEIGIPVVYDELHHQFSDRGLTREEALTRATATWDETPIVHYSESRQLHAADPSIRPQNHSDYVAGPIQTYGTDADVMIEAKMKEQAVLRYRRENGVQSS